MSVVSTTVVHRCATHTSANSISLSFVQRVRRHYICEKKWRQINRDSEIKMSTLTINKTQFFKCNENLMEICSDR